jgi:Bacterial type III secretion protein (HrpB4)
MSASLERLLTSIAEKSANFIFNIDPARVDRASRGLITTLGEPRSAYSDGLTSSALQIIYDVRWPGFGALVRRLHRLSALPLLDVLRVLQAVALYERRSDVRRCVGRDARSSLIDRIGLPAFDMIVATPGANAGPQSELNIADMPVALLARGGFQALEMHNCWECADSRHLVALCLPFDELVSRRVPSAFAKSALPATDLHGLIERLDLFFPEHAWLFGCDMDKTLSVSTMG